MRPAPRPSRVGVFVSAALILCAAVSGLVRAQSQDLIVDINTAPNRYWNKPVTLKGHVTRVTPDPPGTNRGA
jgi:hypothetical protein